MLLHEIPTPATKTRSRAPRTSVRADSMSGAIATKTVTLCNDGVFNWQRANLSPMHALQHRAVSGAAAFGARLSRTQVAPFDSWVLSAHYIWRIGAMQYLFWFFDWIEGLVPLITIGLEA